jgi:hypothetical protein
MTIVHNLLNASADERPLSFWHFAGPVLAGSVAGGLARMGTKAALASAHPKTQMLGATAVGIAAFWLVAGLGYVALNRRA